MNHQEILEYNKRCAEFLGKEIKVYTDTPTLTWYRFNNSMLLTKDMKFHCDWNWIHEIIEAIEKLPFACVYWSKTYLGKWKIEISYEIPSSLLKAKTKVIFIERESKKEAVVEAINQFLIWHKEK